MTEQPLDLTADEIRLLTDRIANTDKDEGREIAKPLLIVLGSAFLEMLHPDKAKDGTITIQVTEPQAWLLRSKINSGDRTDKQPKLGVEFLRKVYAALLAFDADLSLPDAEGDDLTLTEALTKGQAWLPPEFRLGRAKMLEETTDEYGWEQREV